MSGRSRMALSHMSLEYHIKSVRKRRLCCFGILQPRQQRSTTSRANSGNVPVTLWSDLTDIPEGWRGVPHSESPRCGGCTNTWAYRMALFGRDIARVGDDESQCPLVARLDIQNLRGSLAQFPAPGFRPQKWLEQWSKVGTEPLPN
jgi:hypothetical protein